MGYLTNALVTMLNNLPGFPRGEDFGLGTVLNNVLNIGDPDLLGMSSSQVIYYGTTGSDATGLGTLAAPYATPQKAYDSIPERAGTTGANFFQIQDVTGGTYQAPILDHIPLDGLYCTNVGYRDPAGIPLTGAFSLVAGRAVRQRAATAGYAGTVNSTTHWLEMDYGATYPTWGAALLDSSTPNIDAPTPRFGFGSSMVARPFGTTWEIPINGSSFVGGFGATRFRTGEALSFSGIHFVQSSPGNSVRIQGATFVGCLFGSNANDSWNFDDCIFSSATNLGVFSFTRTIISAAAFHSSITLYGSAPYDSITGVLVENTVLAGQINVLDAAVANLRRIDFDAATPGCISARRASVVFLTMAGTGVGHYVGAGRTSYLTNDGGQVSAGGHFDHHGRHHRHRCDPHQRGAGHRHRGCCVGQPHGLCGGDRRRRERGCDLRLAAGNGPGCGLSATLSRNLTRRAWCL
jgi:hypothetical protein